MILHSRTFPQIRMGWGGVRWRTGSEAKRKRRGSGNPGCVHTPSSRTWSYFKAKARMRPRMGLTFAFVVGF